MSFDPRITPARDDLAASHLRGTVSAARFADGEKRMVAAPLAPLRRRPSADAPLDTEALMGEGVTVYETTDDGWAWGQLDSDAYVGWLQADTLAAAGAPPTHRVSMLRTLAYPRASIKSPPRYPVPFGATVSIVGADGIFAVTAAGDYIPARHLVPLDHVESDFVAVAERFVDTPYLWGGKSALGIDCSGLVQVALTACGIACPRDSDMQQAALGWTFEAAPGDLRRGDLVFWKGHVAIVRDRGMLLHANAFHMAVAIENLRDALQRIAASEGAPTAIKRL